MLGDTITITHNAVSKVLSKINQDNYSSEYLLRSATDEFRIKVRHNNESSAKGEVPFERHNIELRVTTFATLVVPQVEHLTSVTIRTRKGSSPTDCLLAAKAQLGFLSDANVTKLIAWES